MNYEVMNRNDDTFHGEYETLKEAVAAAKSLQYAEVYGPYPNTVLTGRPAEMVTVFTHGGKVCKGCGEFTPSREVSKGICEGCREVDRWNVEFDRENAADMYGR